MNIKILDGRLLASIRSKKIKTMVDELNFEPKLTIVLVGEDFASKKYVNFKIKKAEKLGIRVDLLALSMKTSQKELINVIKSLNIDKSVHGYLIQLPLPKHINEKIIQEYILPSKDVDGLSITNAGRLFQKGENYILPGTPKGIVEILKYNKISLVGKVAAIIGRSNIVGKPLSIALLNEDCTVIMCHSKTDLKILKEADIVISAIGVPNFIKSYMLKKGVTIIDVGINRDKNNKLTGDVDFEDVKNSVYAITPVPGGVGPMTIICIFENLLELIRRK